ncbi:hypothetical protein PLESTM_000047800 [Pleodorina starrii]|nr:hypothetical protein PLESTM_000047800 [Pleodorina starrii]
MPSLAKISPSDSHPLLASQLPSWYPHHSEHSLKSLVIPLPQGFLQYLQEDGVFLPNDTAAVPQLPELDAALLTDDDYRRDEWDRAATAAAGLAAGTAATTAAAGPQPSPSGPLRSGRDGLLSGSPHSSDGADASKDDSDSDSGSEAPDPRVLDWTTRFPQLRSALDAAIASLGGRVVPKLNWSCPTDALWVSPGGSLACRNAEQVVLLLKSSDRVAAHDVTLLTAAAATAAAPDVTPAMGAEGPSAAEAAAETEVCNGPGPAEAEAVVRGTAPRASTQAASSGSASCADRPQPRPQPQAEQQLQHADGGEAGPERRAGDGVDPGGGAAGPGPGSGSGFGSGSGEDLRSRGRGRVPPVGLQPVLVLKKWYNLRPEREFRCFVRGGALVAASQRDVSQTFPALTADVVAEARRRLWAFWRDHMRDSLPLRDYAFDVYVPSDDAATVRLVDINPLTNTTSPLLYDWDELGFGPAAVPSAEALLQRLLQQQRSTGAAGGAEGPGGAAAGAAAAAAAPAAAAGCSGVVDESWMEEAGEGLSALPLPSSAGGLQVRVVQDTSRGAGSVAAAAAEAQPGGGGGGLAGLMGPMLLGSRAALAMPYDMLGIADSVDKLIEAMQQQHRKHQQNKRRRQRGGGGGGAAAGSQDSEDDDDGGGDELSCSGGSDDEEDGGEGERAAAARGAVLPVGCGIGGGCDAGPSAAQAAAMLDIVGGEEGL